jgi:hypothetical protein
MTPADVSCSGPTDGVLSMTTIGVDAGSFFASSAGPGGVNAGFVSRACSAALKDVDWAEVLAELPALALLLEPDDELQAASSSVPAASSTPRTAGRVRRSDLAGLVAVMGLKVSVISPTYLGSIVRLITVGR